MKFLGLALVFVALMVCSFGVASAQDTGSISGTISDPTGAVLSGVTVSVTNAAGVSQTVVSNDQGMFTVKGLTPGVYKVSVDVKGFKPFANETVTVTAGKGVQQDAVLQPAGETTNVNVEGQKVATVETETAEVSGTITEKEITEIGINGRNFNQLITLVPGVTNQTGQGETKVGVTGSAKYSVNGGRVEYNAFDVDGSPVLNTDIAASRGKSDMLIVYPSLDSLQEVQVLSSNYGAMYGRAASGTVLATTKSGTEKYHGDAYEFLRNNVFNARNYFDQTSAAPLYRKNDFGGTLGGPLAIPKLFKLKNTYFFLSEEVRLERSPYTGDIPSEYNHAVPSDAERNGSFSDVCPTSGPTGSAGGFMFTRTLYPDCPELQTASTLTGMAEGYPGNVVPVTAFSQAILGTGIIPRANSNGGCDSTTGSCYDSVVSPSTYWQETLFRVDHDFNEKTRLSFRYIHDAWNTTVTIPQWGFVQNSFPTVQNYINGPGTSIVAQLTQTISNTMLNQFTFSYTHDHITLSDTPGAGVSLQRPAVLDAPCGAMDPTTGYQQCPMGALFNNGFGGKIPGIVIAGTNLAYGGSGFNADTSYMPWNFTNPIPSFRDDVSKVIGQHTLHIGLQYLYNQQSTLSAVNGGNLGNVQGLLTYSNQNSYYTSYNAFADFLSGPTNVTGGTTLHANVQSFQQDSAQAQYTLAYTAVEPYVQDDWKVRPNLTVNAGFRASLFGNWNNIGSAPVYNFVPSAFSPELASQVMVNTFTGGLQYTSTGQNVPINLNNLDPHLTNGLVECGKNGVSSSCMSSHIFNPAPRIGLAWDPTGTGKISVRAGYGIFVEHGTSYEANAGSLIGSAPVVVDITQNKPLQVECIGGGRGDPTCPASGAFPLTLTSIPTKATYPYVQQWSLSLQRQLPLAMVATVAYVGSKGTHLSEVSQINQLQVLPASLNPFLPGQALTYDVCNTFTGSGFLVNSNYYGQGSPQFTNLAASCYGVVPGKGIDPNSLREFYPGMGPILAVANNADSSYNALQATLQRGLGPLTVGVAYTYSHSIDDSSDRSDASFVNSLDLSANRASSDFDQRHNLTINYVYKLPVLNLPPDGPKDDAGQQWGGKFDRILNLLWNKSFAHCDWSGVTFYRSGNPFSVVNGGSANGISVLDNAGLLNGYGIGSYPNLVGSPYGLAPAGSNNAGSFGPILGNPAAYAAPEGLTTGNAGRNVMTNPSRLNFDMALLKNYKVLGEKDLQFRVEAFNVFNHTQFEVYDPSRGNTGTNTISCYGPQSTGYSAAGGGGTNCLYGSSFLHPVLAFAPRTLQLGVKLIF